MIDKVFTKPFKSNGEKNTTKEFFDTYVSI